MAASAQLLLSDHVDLWARTAPRCDVLIVVYDGHGENGAMMLMLPFMAVVLIFDETLVGVLLFMAVSPWRLALMPGMVRVRCA